MNLDWLHGPHAVYILAAYGLGLSIAVWCALAPGLKRRRLLRDIRLQQRAETVQREESRA